MGLFLGGELDLLSFLLHFLDFPTCVRLGLGSKLSTGFLPLLDLL